MKKPYDPKKPAVLWIGFGKNGGEPGHWKNGQRQIAIWCNQINGGHTNISDVVKQQISRAFVIHIYHKDLIEHKFTRRDLTQPFTQVF